MSLGDIKWLTSKNGTGFPGSAEYSVAASATLIYPGEPVALNALGDASVIPMATNAPVVGTHFVVGIAVSTSTNTAAAAGKVQVVPADPNDVWVVRPKVAATFDTQAKYDALANDRVLLDLTTGAYTILAADGATYGCVIQPKKIGDGLVAFSFRDAAFYKA
jgi:hypothetical protein